jgi:uncharacterized membrane protein
VKGFFQNPVLYLVVFIIGLIVVATYLETIISIAALIVVAIVFVFVVKLAFARWFGKKNDGTYCTNCPHPSHGRQRCNQCQCARS